MSKWFSGDKFMEQHPFDVYARVTAKAASEMEIEAWSPPTISDGGQIVYAETRASAKPQLELTEAELTRKQAYDDGFTSGKKAGFESGRTEGMAAGKELAVAAAHSDMKPKLIELNNLLTSLSHSLNEEDYKLEKTLMELVERIACAVINKELSLEPASLMKVIKETISALPPGKDSIKIHLNPLDKPFADEAVEAGGENWRVIADEAITRGGCKIESEHSEADMTVESRIENVLEQLYEQQAVSPKLGEAGYEPAPEPAVGEPATSHCESNSAGIAQIERANKVTE
ncbi:MAG: flagellar assembly protein FliH [Pseudohongiellaceae bacterium]